MTPKNPTPSSVITFTVVIRNQGTGMAWSPNAKQPEQHGGFYVDFFIDPNPEPQSYPWNVYGEIFAEAGSLAAGKTREVVFVHQGGLSSQTHTAWAKVDNYYDSIDVLEPWQKNSLVPESNEENNVKFIEFDIIGHTVFLPAVLKSP